MASCSSRSAGFALLVVLGLLPGRVDAAGFAIFEQGARGMGFGGAFTAQTSDPSSIFHNAAGIAFLDGKQLYLGATAIAPKQNFTGADPYPGSDVTEKGDAGVVIPPAADYTQRINDRLVVGIGVHVPYGLRTRWQNRDTTYTGRFVSKEAEVQAFSINPTVAYKLADRLAVGVGLDFRIAKLSLKRNAGITNPFTQTLADVAAVDLESDRKTGFGFNLGLIAQPTESLSFGVSYRHHVKMDFTGTANFSLLPTGNGQFDAAVAASLPSGAVPVTTSIDFPSIVAVGAAYEWNEWTFAADVDFHNWSSFEELPVTFEGYPQLSDVIHEDYVNTRIYRVGAERRINEVWAARAGYFYDENPSPTESVSPLLPDADRHGVAAGFSYQPGSFRVDVAYWHLFFKERSTEGINRDNFNGIYKSSANLFAVSIGYSF